jgi:DNA-binding IclR family transcriptional regulator
MDRPPRAGSAARALQAKGLETERASATPRCAGAGDPVRGHPGKPVGAGDRAAGLHRGSEARPCGFAVDRGTILQGNTHMAVPVLSPAWELVLTAVGPLRRAMQAAAARLTESVRWLRLG